MIDPRLCRFAESFYSYAVVIPHYPAPPGTPRWHQENREQLQKKLDETQIGGEGAGFEVEQAKAISDSFQSHKAQNTELYQAAVKASKIMGMPAQMAFALIGDHYNQTGELPNIPDEPHPKIEEEINKLVNEYGMTEEDARAIVEAQYASTGEPPEIVEILTEDEVRVAKLQSVFKFASPKLIKWALSGG